MKWTFEVRRVEFELNDGRGRSEELEATERRATAEYNEAFSRASRRVVEAPDLEAARRELARSIERETGWDVLRVEADCSLLEPTGR